MNIAIDGPAGAGKSTIARRVAKEKGYIYVDTGAMYRAIGLYFMNEGVDAENAAAVLEALAAIQVEIKYEAGEQQVYLNGKNVSKEIRQEAVGNMASKVATKQAVRDKLLDLQRNLAATQDVVMDGRGYAPGDCAAYAGGGCVLSGFFRAYDRRSCGRDHSQDSTVGKG